VRRVVDSFIENLSGGLAGFEITFVFLCMSVGNIINPNLLLVDPIKILELLYLK